MTCRTHELKCWPGPYAAVASGEKTFELRRNDRNFGPGDRLRLREWLEGYTGNEVTCKVTHVMYAFAGLSPDYCVMSVRLLKEEEP